MYYIGFTNKYYTLWSVYSEDSYVQINGETRKNGIKTHHIYIQNLSYDLVSAKLRAEQITGEKNITFDSELKGKNHSFYSFEKISPYMNDEFDKGKFAGQKIEKCTDIDYLKWSYDNLLYDNRREIAKIILLKNGYVEHPFENNEILRKDELKSVIKQEEKEKYLNSLKYGFNFKNGEKVKLTVNVLNIYSYKGRYGYVYTYEFATDDLKVLKYKGSIDYDIEEDDKLIISGTIKHNKYFSYAEEEEITETKILRMKVLEKLN